MNLENATHMAAAYTIGADHDAREWLVVVIKGTFRFLEYGEPEGHFELADRQQPLIVADTFTGEPGASAPLQEMDLAPFKPNSEVLLKGSAHAPGGRPTDRVEVGIRVGDWTKTMAVVGERNWESGLTGVRATPAQDFISQPIGYDYAFGGLDNRHPDPARHAAYMDNPVGRGFAVHTKAQFIDGLLLPSTEEIGRAVKSPTQRYRPMAFGPLGRAWAPRSRYAGTYDQAWIDEQFPFLPHDFNPLFYQAAPADQQLPRGIFDRGPTPVVLVNLTPEGITQFTVPQLVAPVYIFPKRGEVEELHASLDTLTIDTDARCYTLTWRVSRPLRRSLHEVNQVLVGRKGTQWWQQLDGMEPLPYPLIPMPIPITDVEESEAP